MESLKELYRVGPGPSSSHTLAIQHACLYFMKQYPNTQKHTVDLYGSLSLTGKGHRTDKIIVETFEKHGKEVVVNFKDDWNVKHPNTLVISVEDTDISMTIYSDGGGLLCGTPVKSGDQRAWHLRAHGQIAIYRIFRQVLRGRRHAVQADRGR